jgi:hypothetical protein
MLATWSNGVKIIQLAMGSLFIVGDKPCYDFVSYPGGAGILRSGIYTIPNHNWRYNYYAWESVGG